MAIEAGAVPRAEYAGVSLADTGRLAADEGPADRAWSPWAGAWCAAGWSRSRGAWPLFAREGARAAAWPGKVGAEGKRLGRADAGWDGAPVRGTRSTGRKAVLICGDGADAEGRPAQAGRSLREGQGGLRGERAGARRRGEACGLGGRTYLWGGWGSGWRPSCRDCSSGRGAERAPRGGRDRQVGPRLP
jgi:hypothetical protein